MMSSHEQTKVKTIDKNMGELNTVFVVLSFHTIRTFYTLKPAFNE